LKSIDKLKLPSISYAIVLSIFFHAAALILFLIFKLDFEFSNKQSFVSIDFIKTIPTNTTTDPIAYKLENYLEYPAINEFPEEDELLPDKIVNLADDEPVITANDPFITNDDSAKYTAEQLKFALTLLDSLLVLHPGYKRFILTEQLKSLKEESSPFTKPEIRLNTFIRKLLKENYPEGSDNGVYDKLNPGINIPIDKLIDFVKDIIN
jgi:hypothetical protein